MCSEILFFHDCLGRVRVSRNLSIYSRLSNLLAFFYDPLYFCGICCNISSFISDFIYLSLLFFLVVLAKSLSILFSSSEKTIGEINGFIDPFFKKKFFLMFLSERESNGICGGGAESRRHRTGRGLSGSTLSAQSPTRGLNSLWDPDLSWSQTLNPLSHPGTLHWSFLLSFLFSISLISVLTFIIFFFIYDFLVGLKLIQNVCRGYTQNISLQKDLKEKHEEKKVK